MFDKQLKSCKGIHKCYISVVILQILDGKDENFLFNFFKLQFSVLQLYICLKLDYKGKILQTHTFNNFYKTL